MKKQLVVPKREDLPIGIQRLYNYCDEHEIGAVSRLPEMEVYIRSIDVKEVVNPSFVSASCESRNGWVANNNGSTSETRPAGIITLYHNSNNTFLLGKNIEDSIERAVNRYDDRRIEDLYHETAHALITYVDTYGNLGSRNWRKEEGVAELYGDFMAEYSKLTNAEEAFESLYGTLQKRNVKLDERNTELEELRNHVGSEEELENWLDEKEANHRKRIYVKEAIEAYEFVNDRGLELEDLIFSNYANFGTEDNPNNEYVLFRPENSHY